jgi:hypothetical protein
MIIKEYEKGLIDHDPAIIQNTGVVQGLPIHVDIGQFAQEKLENPSSYKFTLCALLGMWTERKSRGHFLLSQYRVVHNAPMARTFAAVHMPSRVHNVSYKLKILEKTNQLESWLKHNYPELVPFLNQTLNELLKQSCL